MLLYNLKKIAKFCYKATRNLEQTDSCFQKFHLHFKITLNNKRFQEDILLFYLNSERNIKWDQYLSMKVNIHLIFLDFLPYKHNWTKRGSNSENITSTNNLTHPFFHFLSADNAASLLSKIRCVFWEEKRLFPHSFIIRNNIFSRCRDSTVEPWIPKVIFNTFQNTRASMIGKCDVKNVTSSWLTHSHFSECGPVFYSIFDKSDSWAKKIQTEIELGPTYGISLVVIMRYCLWSMAIMNTFSILQSEIDPRMCLKECTPCLKGVNYCISNIFHKSISRKDKK